MDEGVAITAVSRAPVGCSMPACTLFNTPHFPPRKHAPHPLHLSILNHRRSTPASQMPMGR